MAIATLKGISAAAAANASAIIASQLSVDHGEFFSTTPVVDSEDRRHAGVMFSVVILRGTQGQLQRLSKTADEGLRVVSFLDEARALNNEFAKYVELVAASADDAELVAVGIVGEDSTVRQATKALSVL